METTTNTPAKLRTITLTDRPPVRIREDAWPVVAKALADVSMRNGTPLPSYECAEWRLTVRQHSDGRAIIYGVADAPSPGWNTHGCTDWRGGELLDAGADLVAAIRRVGAQLVEHGGAPGALPQECIADLPAVDLA